MTTDAPQTSSPERLGAIVMANGEACKLARKLDVPHKALLDVDGAAMIDRVLQAVQGCPQVDEVIVSCRPDGPIARHLGDRAPLAQPADPTFLGGIAEAFRLLPEMDRALLVTCDMPLLTPDAVGYFAREAASWPAADLVYGMVDVCLTQQQYPETRRTAIRLREGSYTASGLTVVSRRFVEHCGPLLMNAFQARKSKVAMGQLLGFGFLVRFALGTLSLQQIIDRAEELLQGKCAAIAIPYPECGFDVDSEADLAGARAVCLRPPAAS